MSLKPRQHRLGMLAIAGMLLPALAFSPVPAAQGAEPVIRTSVQRVLTPLAGEQDLDVGFVRMDRSRGHYALEIEVDPGDGPGGWILYVRSDGSSFAPEGAGKPCSDLLWKLDEEDDRSYRRLSDHETVVLENPEGGKARIMLDISVDVDWRTDPGTYGIELLFRTEFL